MSAIRDEIIRLAKADLMDVEIAARLGISASKVGYYRRQAEVPKARNKKPNNKPSDELIEKMQKLATEDGWPPCELQATFGLSYKSVHRWCDTSQSGKEWNKVARWAALHHRELYEELIA